MARAGLGCSQKLVASYRSALRAASAQALGSFCTAFAGALVELDWKWSTRDSGDAGAALVLGRANQFLSLSTSVWGRTCSYSGHIAVLNL